MNHYRNLITVRLVFALLCLVALTAIIYLGAWAFYRPDVYCRMAENPFICYRGRLLYHLEKNGPGEAQESLKSLYADGLISYLSCHSLGHELGKETLRSYGSLPVLLNSAKPYCGQAYSHGLMQAFFNEDGHRIPREKVADKMKAACGHFDQRNIESGACFHGAGHGLWHAAGTDLLEALQFCDMYDEWQGGLCYEGAFMENVFSLWSELGKPGAFIRRGDPLFVCQKIDTQYRSRCYWRSVPLQIFLEEKEIRPSYLMSLESRIPENYKEAFWLGIGREVNLLFSKNGEEMRKYCGELHDYGRKNCLSGAALWIALKEEGIFSQAESFCNTLSDKKDKEHCLAILDGPNSLGIRQ